MLRLAHVESQYLNILNLYSMPDEAKIEYPNFIKTTIIAFIEDAGSKKAISLKVRINPLSITSYVEGIYRNENNEAKPCTVMYAGGTAYNLEMNIEEVDEMMQNIERGFQINQ